MSQGWGDLYEGRKSIQKRFGRIHSLPVVRRIHEVLLRHLQTDDCLLDVGAGARRLSETLTAKGCHVAYRSLDSDRTHAHDFASLDEVQDTFDAVTCFEVLEHVPQPQIAPMLEGMARVIRDDGYLFVSTPNVYKPQEFLRDATHCTPLCYDQLGSMIEAAGFRVESIHRACGDRLLRKFVRRGLLGWLYRTLDLDFARQILVVAKRSSGTR